jgi:glutathione S-transferase
MIQLIQFPWSPYCLVQKQILKFADVPHKAVNIPPSDRSLVWRLTRQRYYQVPIVKDGRNVIFETDANSQVIAKYLDDRFHLDLFPRQWAGVQNILWRYVENDVEECTFKLNDAHFQEFVPVSERLNYIRYKERKFGRNCLQQWLEHDGPLIAELTQRLIPFEQMLETTPFLLEQRPRFIDFDLFGMIENFLYSGHYELPAAHVRLKQWYERMAQIKHSSLG